MALTFGNTSAPLSITTNLDSVFATSLASYRKTLIDNIGATNAVLYHILKSDAYEVCEGGTYIGEELMYALAPADSYDGYDELSTATTDGITQADYSWRQISTPISYNMKEVIQNRIKLVSLVKSRIMQSEMGIQEGWAQQFWWGSQPQGGSLVSPRLSTANGSLGIDPLPLLVSYNTSGSVGTAVTVGGLSEFSFNWWQNHSFTCSATTYSDFIRQIVHAYNTCALGTGGPPNLMVMDQTTYELFVHAYFSVFKAYPGKPAEYPFEATKFLNATVVMDDKVPDVASGVAGSQVGGVVNSSSLTFGSIYFLNTKFFKVRYASDRNWDMLTDENGKTFAKPINGDSRVGHVAWMGNLTMNNRRKQGVMGQIPRSFAS